MNWIEELIIAVGSVLTGGMSLWMALKKTSTQKEINTQNIQQDHTETILGGYSKIVDDLREEVIRLNEIIFDLRKEQEECERRNDELAKVVNELKQRVGFLEGGKK